MLTITDNNTYTVVLGDIVEVIGDVSPIVYQSGGTVIARYNSAPTIYLYGGLVEACDTSTPKIYQSILGTGMVHQFDDAKPVITMLNNYTE